MAMEYTSEQIQVFRKKDLQQIKLSIIGNYIRHHGTIPGEDFMELAVSQVYAVSELDKVRINPDYIPTTPDGQPFDAAKMGRKPKKVSPSDLSA